MFAVTSANKADPTTLTFYLINGVTGRIIHQFKESDVSSSPQHKVSTLFSEQFFTVSFMRTNPATGFSQSELTVIELYSQKKEADTKQLITDYLKGVSRITENKYSSFSEEGEPVILRESYFLPFGVKALGLTETESHITGRTLIFVTIENKLF